MKIPVVEDTETQTNQEYSAYGYGEISANVFQMGVC